MPAHPRTAAVPLFFWLAFFALDAHAAIDNADILDSVLERYSAAASGWAGVITDAASWLFWTLVLISMVWTFGMMALRKADIGEFFAEFVRFTIFTGFFWWLLTNGPHFADSIIQSLRQLAGNATGLGGALSPSGVVDIGFAMFDKVVDQSSVWSPVNSAVGMILAAIILVILALIGVNMLLLLVSGWILAYGGVFFLGFGGSRWTSDMAINYYKTVLGVASQLLTMVLLVGIGKTFLDDYYNAMSEGISIKEMGVMLIVAVVLLALVNKLPALVAGIITGASIGGAGIGNFSAGMITGAAIGAAGAASAAASLAGSAAMGGALNIAGGASAIRAAFQKAQANLESGPMPSLSALGGGSSGADSVSRSVGNTPFAMAAGFASSASADSGLVRLSPAGSSKSTGGPSSGSSTKGGQGSTGGGLTRAAALAVGTTTELAKGTMEVAKAKVAGFKGAAMERVAETTGGQIAAAIKGQDSQGESDMPVPESLAGPAFGENSLASANSREVDPESEVAAFRDRDKPRHDKRA